MGSPLVDTGLNRLNKKIKRNSMIKKEQEVWKTYPEIPFIEASNLGRIRTKDRVVVRSDGRRQFVKGRVLKQQLRPDGYMQVHIGISSKSVNLFVHRIVAVCFIPNPNNLPEVNHKDCDPTNNIVSNLEWCTHQENIAYRTKLGHTAKHNAPKKSVIAINPDTGEVFWFESQTEAERQLGVSESHVCAVVRGQRKIVGGCWFCRADETAVEKAKAKFSDEVANKIEKLIREHI